MEEQARLERRRDAETAFLATVETADTTAVRPLIKADRSLVNSFRSLRGKRNYYKTETALTAAIKRGRLQTVELLLASGADPNMPDGKDAAPLVAVLWSNGEQPALMSALLSKGGDPRKGDTRGKTPLLSRRNKPANRWIC
jgi:ankyrin repeat protein